MRSLLIGMVAFDFIAHLYELITKEYLFWMDSGVYQWFWTIYWGLFLILLIYELTKNGDKKQDE